MEKPVSSKKITIFKYFSKPTFLWVMTQPPPTDHLMKLGTLHKSPIASIIPLEALDKKKNGSFDSPAEPMSPKVSCMGEIKHRTKASKPKTSPAMRNVSKRKAKPGPIVGGEIDAMRPAELARAPSVGEMRRFNCGRGTLRGFDWRAVSGLATCHAGGSSCYVEDNSGEEKVVMAQVTPVLVVSGRACHETRKEINLWKRRSMVPLAPIQFD